MRSGCLPACRLASLSLVLLDCQIDWSSREQPSQVAPTLLCLSRCSSIHTRLSLARAAAAVDCLPTPIARHFGSSSTMSCTRLKQNLSEPQGCSTAIVFLVCPRGSNKHEVAKSGIYIYHQDASQYQERELKTRLRVEAAGDEEGIYAETMSQVVRGRRGGAFAIPNEIGLESIWSPGDEFQHTGVVILAEAIRANVLPLTTREPK